MNGTAVITAIDRHAGTFTVSSVGAFFDAKKVEIDRLYEQFADSMSRYIFDNAGATLANAADVVHFEKGMVLTLSPSGPATALECGIAAAVALGGLGWIIARRNALAGTEEASVSWVRAVAEWLVTLIRGLFAGAPQLPPRTEEA